MTILISNVATTDTFQKLLTTVNLLVNVVSNSVVTVNSNTAIGDASISGNISSNGVITNFVNTSTVTTVNISSNSLTSNTANLNYIYVGNSTINATINSTSFAIQNATANINLTVPTSGQISNGNYYLNANGTWALATTITPLSNGTLITTGLTAQVVDYYPMATYKSAEYLLGVNDNNANNHYSAKIMTMHDTFNAYSTEYASLVSNNTIGVFSVSTNSTHLILLFNPTSSNTSISFSRIIV